MQSDMTEVDTALFAISTFVLRRIWKVSSHR